MLTATEYLETVARVLGADRRPNPGQVACIAADPHPAQLIVAGPGTGKTTVLVLRALRHVLVDRFAPEDVIVTTFTKKAAREIRSRLIEWGIPLIDAARVLVAGRRDTEAVEFLSAADVNRFVTGTLDSLCEEILTRNRGPSERPPVVIEAFAANQLLARRGNIHAERTAHGAALGAYLAQFTHDGEPPRNLGDTTRTIRTIVDRFVQDGVDLAGYVAEPGPHFEARAAVARIYERYADDLAQTNRMDFSRLEAVFLERLRSDVPPQDVLRAQALLIDEYQDTNPIQERIYFEIVRLTGASLTVVGDDDQSLYRFRGATVELFREFVARLSGAVGCAPPALRYLTENYRSTPEVVEFFNSFIENDPGFVTARVQPPKPRILATRDTDRLPVLGLFRASKEELAQDLAALLHDVFRGDGRPADDVLSEPIRRSAEGDFGDAVLISHSVAEYRAGFGAAPRTPRLPSLLRSELGTYGVRCFNPRGQALRDIEDVRVLLGLALECLDPVLPGEPKGAVERELLITNSASSALAEWRAAAHNFLRASPPGHRDLAERMAEWRAFTTRGEGPTSEWPLLDLIYSLITWLPAFRDDPECQVYLEAISRCASQSVAFSAYRGLLMRDDPHRDRSVGSAIRDFLVPVADGLVEVDEEIMPSVPRDRLNVMTIHQAKGLEFPMVIVDIASDYTRDHPKQRFRRFPGEASSVALLEDELAPCTEVGPSRTERSALARTFDDLVRLYYVAYSRPQSVLLLTGCIPCLRRRTSIRNVATFWTRAGTWPWQGDDPAGQPLAGAIPLTLI